MKKLISILTVFAMVLAFAAIPAMAADVTVDFTSEDNLAYGKPVSHISGTYYTSGTRVTPKTNQYALTDGCVADKTTDGAYSEYYAYPPATKTTVAFQLNLGDVYAVDKVAIYIKASRTLSIYASTTTDYESGTLIANEVKGVDGTVNGQTCSELLVELDTAVPAQYITFVQKTGGSSTYYREVYVSGTSATEIADADKVAADKTALDLGDTTAVTANLTLPTAGNAYGSTITWATTDASVITDAGVITRGGEDKTATLTATITNGTVTDTKTFDVTVKGYEVYNLDLSAENNILLGKTVTPIAGYYYSSSTPSAEKQYATDGNLSTYHSGYGTVSGATTGVVFSVNLEDEYLVDNVTVLLDQQQPDREIKVYNGPAVDESKLLGTYTCAAGEANYVVAGEQSKALSVYSCDLPEATVASQLTFAYENGYGFTYYEIAATGRAVQEGEIIRDFTSSDNLAYKKDNQRVIGHFYDGWTPASDDLATDGDIATTKRCAGRFSGDDSGSGYYGSAFRIDLGAYYDLTELTLYTTTTTSSISFRSEDAFTVTGSGQQSTPGGYILNSLGGQLHTNGFATVGKDDYELVTVNGTEVYQYSADLSNNAQPVRYIIVHLNGGTWTYNELYVAGTPFTGEVAFAEGDFVYAEDAEAGTKTVTAQVSLMNKTDAATTGNLFYGAYNEAGELVGMTKVADVAVEAGATYSAPTTFAVSAPAGYVKAFYWADGTFVPVIADIICD
ncbi:MAG: hypothetical protein E7406_02870 [Ruminococcaceae bacterium]|nr:hypothetical protein [Oscillospiraceae bacterium]